MNKNYWKKLKEIFETEELVEKYSDTFRLIELVNESISLDEQKEKINNELQEMNKEEK